MMCRYLENLRLLQLMAPMSFFEKDIFFTKLLYSDEPPWRTSALRACTELRGLKKNSYQPETLRAMYSDHFVSHSNTSAVYFTDGSKTADAVSCAFIRADQTQTYTQRIQKRASIFTAELIAVERAVHAAAAGEEIGPVVVCTDSKSAVQGIMRYMHPNPIIQEIQQAVGARGEDVILCWVPSHIGVPLNEKADEAARLAADLPETPVDIPRTDQRNYARASIIRHWCEASDDQ